jgi:hypothetical protein
VSNERQLVLYENTKDDKKIVPLLVEKKYYMKFENSVVTQNVTRDFSICLPHKFLILRQIVMKLWSFYPLIVVNSWIKYQDQKVCLSYTRGKILQKCHARFYSEKLSREIIMDITTSKLKQRWMHNISLDFYI